MEPNYPLISIYNDALELIPDSSILTKATVWTVLNDNCISVAFDGDGRMWTYELLTDNVQDNFLTRLLAKTVYNPRVEVQLRWILKDNYELSKLKSELNGCIDKDDDVLTQFVEAEIIKQAIIDSKTFEEIYALLMKYVFDVDEEELWKEVNKQN
ncbi:MAG TPA: hypothetical protein DCE41_13310 [Cytophagales bacterium]|nr:hypothetical protein [Cytophagales bacterium]HAA22454.1 hypothetical protein [Cytophagales bacterium]HAP59745.1 hypothetical protein [Cytophagales bacterium]